MSNESAGHIYLISTSGGTCWTNNRKMAATLVQAGEGEWSQVSRKQYLIAKKKTDALKEQG